MRIACAHQNIHIIKDRLLFSILRSKPRNTNQFYYFTVEDDPEFQYRPFFDDFGPPSLPKLCRFVHKVRKLLEERKENIVHFYSSPSPTAKSNMSLYISFFRMIHLNLTAKEAYQPIEPISGRLKPFRDASNSKSLLDLTVLDVLKGIQKAMDMNFFDFEKFDIQKWEELEQLAKGNMNWIVPNKLLAMSTPYSFGEIPNSGRSNPDNKEEEVPPIKLATPKDVIPTLKDELGITDVVRLNKKFYDAAEFKENGLNHTDLYFPDGTIPPDRIIQEFFKILDEEKSVVAVHCKAGLGRAGTLCGCFLKREYDFSGREALGWLRVCRPGSVIGIQQQFLMRFMSDELGYNSFSGFNTSRPKTSRERDPNICTLDMDTGAYSPRFPLENEPPVKRMFTTPSKGFRLSTINMADYYDNNPKRRVETKRAAPLMKLWTSPRERLPPVITLPMKQIHPMAKSRR